MKVLEDGTVKGTFKYVTDYTEFSSNTEEQNGYYFPFSLKKSGTKMTFKKNGSPVKEGIAYEKDNVFRVTSSDTFTVSVDDEDVITFKFNQANFNEE